METPSIKVTVNATTRSQDPLLGSLSTVVIRINQKTEEFLINDTDGCVISSLGSYASSSLPDRRISLELSDFAPDNIHQHLFSRVHDRVLSQLISNRIVFESVKRDLPQGPLFIKLSVELTHKSYMVVPSSTSVPYKSDSESDTCAICLEDLSESKTEICQLPHCLHLFHERCLLKWLDRDNATCPLCRRGVDYNQSKAVESN